MSQPLNWQWLLAMTWWNPMPHSKQCLPQGPDDYCPKSPPLVRPCLPAGCDDYLMKPLVNPDPECRRVCDPYIRKPFPVVFKNNLTGCQPGDGWFSPGWFGMKPRP